MGLMNNMVKKGVAGVVLMVAMVAQLSAQDGTQRVFSHPGLSYNSEDLVRMKQMIAAKVEPAYSTFEALVANGYSKLTNDTFEDITSIAEGKHNNTIGIDGRKAHDLALLYRLTDDSRYADEALKHINRYNNLTNVSMRGTAPLDGGKIYLLIEAAELLRDYTGWDAADKEAFKKMLTYPAYSMTEYPSEHANMDDELNAVTFYWNIYNLDPTRWGNQGLFAARGMMAMGIFLDNEAIYDRALRYVMAQTAREDDLPYHLGYPKRGAVNSDTDYMTDYKFQWVNGPAQFISDAALPYYVYANGQCQEACRDQGHVMAGLGQLVDLAEMAWNQGDNLYGAYDNRILRGLEWALRYNLSAIVGEPWEPSGYSTSEDDCTFDNGMFYQADSRSLRWSGKTPYDQDRLTSLNNVRYLQQALNHYKNRAKVEPADYQWLQLAADHQLSQPDAAGVENWGASGHHYEWKGWGTLTKTMPKVVAGIQVADEDVAESSPLVYDLNGRVVGDNAKGIVITPKGKYLRK